MSEISSAALRPARHTALHDVHRRLGGKLVPFSGWEMPVEYSGILAEHRAVRECAGMFDVSHMGEISIQGPQALDLVQYVTCNDASRLSLDQCQYSGLMTPQGTFVDDLVVNKFTDQHYWLIVNAANRDRDFEHLCQHNHFDAQVVNVSEGYTQLAVQGPATVKILQPLTPVALAPIRYYRFTVGKLLGVDCIISRTGYTGEDGFELYFDPEHSESVWNGILEAGRAAGLLPCGLGARNTLRMEAGMALYGHEIDTTTTPLEAGLGWITKLSKPDFLGKAVIAQQAERGLTRKLIGFEMEETGIARDGHEVLHQGQAVGRVTSAGPAPSLSRNIGMAYLPLALCVPGTAIDIQIRTRTARARVVPLPFYKRRN